ncbi:MAG TPA: TraR/DksA family transcriptional regulator [Thermoanaerobaculia bacterium]|nr:TraR/DksA family transcriptional regulator [Thermoanaerobaculia bacterium]HXT49897.1 TraR/DksA family transcriptional regulator [Thermoanaerobaculia bacterium]
MVLKQTATKSNIDELGGIDVVRRLLTTQRDEILAMYEHDVKAGQEASDEGSDDIVDRANNAYSRELLFSLSDGERHTLLRIEEALQRTESGTYGICTNCGNEIRPGRLKAMPWARYCIDCQELAEKGMLEEA